MGLSASQARLLSLTARQSNLEYEGQQINQQRTTLSNQSSNYYNSLLEMDVPVPPSMNDYTKIVYTFMINGNEGTIKECLPTNNDNGTVSYTISYTTELATMGIKENSAYKTSASAVRTQMDMTALLDGDKYNEGDDYYVAAINRVDASTTITPKGKQYIQEVDAAPTDENVIVIGPNGYQIAAGDYDPETCKMYKKFDADKDDASEQKYCLSYTKIANQDSFEYYKKANVIYKGTKGTEGTEGTENNTLTNGVFTYKSINGNEFTTVDPEYGDAFVNAGLSMNDYYQYQTSSGIRFVKREDVEGNLNNQAVLVETSAVGTINVKTQNVMKNATIEFDASGRIATIGVDENTYIPTATTETDSDAYDDAYNQYEYNQYLYDQKQNEINANIKILQAQDKSLELRLSSLDTQHTAIQTELEAVKKVMSKNIDNSFKTFNA